MVQTPVQAIDRPAARKFIGHRVPPFPEGVALEFGGLLPYGEGYYPPGTSYGLFLVNKGGAQMLWIGLEFADADYRITDAIPFPPLHEGEIYIPSNCSRGIEYDIYLVAVARCGPPPLTDIVRAWRINPETEAIDEVSTRAIYCWTW